MAERGGRLVLLIALAVGAFLLVRGPAVPHDGDVTSAVPHDGDVTSAVPHDDGGVTGAATLEPTLHPAPAPAAATGTAQRFAAEWSTPGPDWQQRVAALSTPTLAAALADADPPRPAPRVARAPAVPLLWTPQWSRVAVATDRGELVLDLVRVGGGWVVAGIDWRAPAP